MTKWLERREKVLQHTVFITQRQGVIYPVSQPRTLLVPHALVLWKSKWHKIQKRGKYYLMCLPGIMALSTFKTCWLTLSHSSIILTHLEVLYGIAHMTLTFHLPVYLSTTK